MVTTHSGKCAALFLFLLAGTLWGAEVEAKLNEKLFLGKPVVAENATVWPVFASQAIEDPGEYMTMAQAQEKNTAVVREMGARAGAGGAGGGDQVNQLVIDNKGDKAILVLAGTLVKGGNQDRQIAEDFIIPPGKSVDVGAFCVEHGRWAAVREQKATDGVFDAQEVLALKSVRNAAQHKANQSEVWNKVALENARTAKNPESGTLFATIDEQDPKALERRERIKKAIDAHFKAAEDAGDRPVGLAYAINGKIKEIRTFAHPRIYSLYHKTLVNTVAVEADVGERELLEAKKEAYRDRADAKKAVELVEESATIKEDVTKTKALNSNGYARNKIVNKASVYNGNKSLSESWQPAE